MSTVREVLAQRIPPDSMPTRFHTRCQVKIWHARRVILDSSTWAEAAKRLDISKKTLWMWRDRYGIPEEPGQIDIN